MDLRREPAIEQSSPNLDSDTRQQTIKHKVVLKV